MALVLVFVGIKLFSGERSARPAPPGSANPLTPEEMKALGIEGDTPRDTVATLVAQVKQLRNELQTALNDNKNQKTENERMRARESAIDQRIQSALDGERGRLQQDREQLAGDRQQTQGLLQDLQRRLDGLSGKSGQADLPVGLGLEEGDGKNFGGNQGGSARNTNGTRWVEPDDAKPSAKNGSSGGLNFPTSFGPAQKTLSDTADGVASTVADAGSRAVGASAAGLHGAVELDADGLDRDDRADRPRADRRHGQRPVSLQGADRPRQPHRQRHRHPRRGRRGGQRHGLGRLDAFLRARPDPLGHVRLQRRHDPHRAGGRQSESEQRQSGQQREQHDAGWPGLDQRPYGIPCVSGERRSNAQQYLGSQALITAAGGASLIKSDNGSVAVVANSNGSLGTVGISGNEAMGRILAGGVRDMADWVNKLYGQAFAAVYVRPGAKVAVHLEQPLNIDYDAKGPGQSPHRRRPCVGFGLNRPRPCARSWCWAAARPARTSCCRTAITPCSTCGTRRRAAAPVADRRPGNCSMRARARRPLTEADVQAAPAAAAAYTRTAANEIYRQFHRLPNPDLVMYVFPHLAGTDPVPVPGYTTVFPLYQRVQYAMPGERLEDY